MTLEHCDCIHDEQIQNHTRKIAELETRADYKEQMIKDLAESIKDIKKSVDSLDKTITDFILKSINDDSNIRELVNLQDNRITALETTNKTLKWVIAIGFTALASFITALSFLITHIH